MRRLIRVTRWRTVRALKIAPDTTVTEIDPKPMRRR